MTASHENWGLVLSGGAARGAYGVGVLTYMAEVGIEPVAISGASIGALNGAVLASAPTFREGVDRLLEIWATLRRRDMFRFDAGDSEWLQGVVFAQIVLGVAADRMFNLLRERLGEQGTHIPPRPPGLSGDSFVRELLTNELPAGRPIRRPFWVSAYPTEGGAWGLPDVRRLLLAEMGLAQLRDPVFFRIDEMAQENRINAILASAALPVIYREKSVDGVAYRDAFLLEEGNTPLKPLSDAGYKRAIVVHLSDGALFQRGKWKEMGILEVRPDRAMHAEGRLISALRFEPERIREWIDQGYADAKRCIGDSLAALNSRDRSEQIDRTMHDTIVGRPALETDEALRRAFGG